MGERPIEDSEIRYWIDSCSYVDGETKIIPKRFLLPALHELLEHRKKQNEQRTINSKTST